MGSVAMKTRPRALTPPTRPPKPEPSLGDAAVGHDSVGGAVSAGGAAAGDGPRGASEYVKRVKLAGMETAPGYARPDLEAAGAVTLAGTHSYPRRHRRSQSPTSSRASSSSRGQSRSRSPRRRRSVDTDTPAGLTPTPGSPRPAPVPERTQAQPCFLRGCPWQGGVDEVVGHARERHASLITPGPRLDLMVPLVDDQELELLRLLDALDELFIVHIKKRAGAKRKLQAAVRLLGPRTRAAGFLYLVQMQQVSEDCDNAERGATRVAFLVSPAHSWLQPAEECLRSLWSARHFARPLQQHSPDGNKILELAVTVTRAQQE